MLRDALSLVIVAMTTLSALTGCSLRRSAETPVPRLVVEQGSFRMVTAVEADGTISLARHTPLLGRIEVAPILEAEGAPVPEVQVMLHRGRYYITADKFLNLWELSPLPGETEVAYRPIRVSGKPLAGVLLSRYGPPGRPCVRVDVEDGGPFYVNGKGRIDDHCS